MNLMQSSAEWLGSQLKQAAGREATIIQGENQYEPVTGWCSSQEYSVMDSEGFTTSMVSFDWQFMQADLPDEFRFREGALLVSENIHGVAEHYEVIPLGNRPCSERLDTSGLMITVHTKQVK